jgi:hypothetical protein
MKRTLLVSTEDHIIFFAPLLRKGYGSYVQQGLTKCEKTKLNCILTPFL